MRSGPATAPSSAGPDCAEGARIRITGTDGSCVTVEPVREIKAGFLSLSLLDLSAVKPMRHQARTVVN
jgi:hypothetical protein